MLKKIIFTFQANFIVAVLTLIITIVTTNFLGASGKGYLSIISTYLSIIQLITGIIGPGTLPFLLRNHRYSSIFILAILWSIVISLVSSFLLNSVGLLSNEIIIVFFLNAFSASVFLLNARMLISHNKIKFYNAIIIFQPSVILAFLFCFGANNFNTVHFFYIQFVSYFIGVFISSIILKNLIFKRVNFLELKLLISESFTLGSFNQLSSFTQLLNYRFSFFLLEKFSGLKSVGIFSIILSFANVIWLFATTVGNLIGDEMNKTTNNRQSGAKLIDKYLKFSLVATLVFLILASITPVNLYVYILGIDFEGIKYYLFIFSPAIFIFSIAKVLAFYFSSLGKVKINFLASVLGLIPTGLGFWFIKNFDLNGVIISTTLSFLASTLFLIYQFNISNSKNVKDA